MNVEAGVSELDDASEGEEALVARARAGDRDAFAALYRHCRPGVYRFIAHMTGSTSVVDDIVQDVFLAAITRLDQYDPARGPVTAWLLGIARNHVRRWQHRRRWLSLTGTEDLGGNWVTTDPLADVWRRRDEVALKRALLDVPLRFREVVVLCDLQDVPYDEAARVLGCPVGTVRSRLHRGRARLLQVLSRGAEAATSRASIARVL